MRQRFSALDGLRGISALAVVLYHMRLLCGMALFAHGYLSVDIFFVISGVVLAAAYGERLEQGMGARAFMLARLRRLAPALWIGILICLAGYVFRELADGARLGLDQAGALALMALQNFLLIPYLGLSDADAFPIDGVSWSLFAELIVNFAFACVAPRLRSRELWLIVLSGYLVFAVLRLAGGAEDFGPAQNSILLSIPRALPSFAMGVLLLRLWRSGALERLPALPPVVVLAGWLALVAVPPLASTAWYDMALVVFAAPLATALLLRPRGATPGWAVWLGMVSYPLYATHAVFLQIGRRSDLFGPPGHMSLWLVPAVVAAALLLAWTVGRLVEPRSGRAPRSASAAMHEPAAG
jgi:peptidoglycan/LPS O-acetylase OafA/YrhL